MAIEKSQLLGILNKEADAEAKADSLLEMIKKDFEEQQTKILVNREQIKKEKTEEINKRHAAEKAKEELESQLKVLQEKLKANNPTEIQKVYETQLQDAKKVYETKVTELQSNLNLRDKEINDLKQEKFKLSCMEEFNKAIADKNVAPDAVQDLSRYVLGDNCSKFSLRSLGEGNGNVIVTEDMKTIKNVLEDVLNNTTFGKRCVVVNTSGGGAEGGSKGIPAGTTNPWKKETFNLTKQAELLRNDPALAAALKAQA